MNYIFNKNTDDKGNHEVHNTKCVHLPYTQNQQRLGTYASCSDAIRAAKSLMGKTNFDGCKHCCPECHTG